MLKMMRAVPGTGQDSVSPREKQESAAAEELRAIAARLSSVAQGMTGGPPTHAIGPEVVAAMLAARRLRDRLFSEGLFTDPGWDILLALYAAYLDGTGLEPAALYQASGVAPGAALRWLDLLVEAGLIVRGSDPLHRRRLRIALTEAAADRMRHYLAEIADPFSL